MEQIFLTPLF